MLARALFCCIFLFLSLSSSDALSSGVGGPVGLYSLKTSDIGETLRKLSADETGSFLIADYILYFRTLLSCRENDLHACLSGTDEFIGKFPHSILTRDVRLWKIESLYRGYKEGIRGVAHAGYPSDDDLKMNFLSSVEKYLKSRPFNSRVMYMYGDFLRGTGRAGEARRVMRKVFLQGGDYYETLKGDFSTDSLTIKGALILGENLTRRMTYKEAEQLLTGLLDRKNPLYVRSIYDSIGDLLYSQKDYRRAARYFLKGRDFYRGAVSFFRSDDFSRFDKVVAAVSLKKTEESCRLLILKGLRERRKGDFEGALRIFRGVYRNGYPCREFALWNIAWAEYLSGNFLSASYNFRDLYGGYGDARYLYWYARSLEDLGGDAERFFNRLAGDSFYGVLRDIRSGGGAVKEAAFHIPAADLTKGDSVAGDGLAPGVSGKVSEERERFFRKVDFLVNSGLRGFALRELLSYEPRGTGEDERICEYQSRIGAYGESIKCASGLGGKGRYDGLLYPLAYRDIVEDVSRRYDIDPYLVYSIMREESRFNEDALSGAGAIGLMQLIPYTAKTMAGRSGAGINIGSYMDIKIPSNNITLGSYYLKSLLDEFDSLPAAIAAYNAGEDIVRKWIKAYRYRGMDEFIEDIPYSETRNYVKRVLRSYYKYRLLGSAKPKQPF